MGATRGIVISKEVFGEADLYVQFLTRDWGVVSLLAKSAKKSKRRFVGGLDLFCHDEIYVKGEPRERALLLELSVLNAFTGIRDNLERALTAGKVIQWAKRLSSQSAPNAAIYSLVGQTLALIEKESHEGRLDLLNLVFKNKLLSELGLKPQTTECAKCESALEEEPLFDIASGGTLCRACSAKSHLAEFFKIGKEEQGFLANSAEIGMGRISEMSFAPSKVNYLSRLLSQFAAYHTHVKLP